jgi:hypothetical protein
MAFAVTNTFTTGTIQAPEVNQNFTDLETELNDFPTNGSFKGGSVNTAALGADAVNGDKIADLAVDTEHIALQAVDTAQIKNNAVTTGKLAAGAVTNADINDVFGTWDDTTYSSGTAYQAATDGIVCAYSTGYEDGALEGFTDANADPTTDGKRVGDRGGQSGAAYLASITMPVKRTHYWRVNNADKISWLPIGA